MMAVDDEQKALNHFLRVLREVERVGDVVSFTASEEAFDYLTRNKVDIAFLDIKMDGLTGIELAEKCKTLCPTVNIIFVTGYSEYSMDALQLHVSGYVMKPVRANDLRMELNNLRYPISNKIPCRVRIHTFGHFEIFVEEIPLPISSAKAKECLAYLVDRKGARVRYQELASVMWENRPYDSSVKNYLYQAVHLLTNALRDAGVQNILLKFYKELAIDVDQVDCDYYAVLAGDLDAACAFTSEYMSQYSWGEPTLAELSKKLKK